MTTPVSVEELRAIGMGHGLSALGVASAEPFADTRRVLEQRKADGLHGDMQFTYRNPARSSDPSATLDGVRSLVIGARSYRREMPDPPVDEGPVSRVASYVWDDDYGALSAALQAVADHLVGAGWRAVVVVDQNNLVDRAAAHRAGIGWYGKSTNLLLPGHGSWFVLGSVLTDASLPTAGAPVPDGCGACTRCLDACPTGAIVAPGVVDARKCLAWSLQVAGPFPRQHRVAVGDRIYGCDECQEVCPPNRRHDRRDPPDAGVGTEAAWVRVLDILDATDDELMARFGHWYVPRRQPRYLRRNALVVLGNTADVLDPGADVVAALERYLAHPDPMLRAHAAWAARRLGRHDLVARLAHDRSSEVRDELAAEPPPVRVR